MGGHHQVPAAALFVRYRHRNAAPQRISTCIGWQHDLCALAMRRGCVFETVGGQHVDGAAFRALRRHVVSGGSSAAACELLFGTAMRQLVRAALGGPGILFNDQVGTTAQHIVHSEAPAVGMVADACRHLTWSSTAHVHKLFARIEEPMATECSLTQYIVKPPQSPTSAFTWHLDSDWLDDGAVTRHPYISVRAVISCYHRVLGETWPMERRGFRGLRTSTCGLQVWCALHDMTEGAQVAVLKGAAPADALRSA